MTLDYDLQLAMMEKRINDFVNPLSVDEIRDDLNLRFERLNAKNNDDTEDGTVEDFALFSGQFKGKCRNFGVIGHKARDCKNKIHQNAGNYKNLQNGAYCTYCRRPGHSKMNCFKLKNKPNRNNNNGTTCNNNGRKNFDSSDVAFMTMSSNTKSTNDTWIFDSGACGHYCSFEEGLINIKEINEYVKVSNGEKMLATKIGDLNCEVSQTNGSKFIIKLKDVKYNYISELCINLLSFN